MDGSNKTLFFVLVVLAAAFVIDVQSSVPVQSTIDPEAGGFERFTSAASDWFSNRSGFEKNVMVYTGLVLVAALVAKNIFRG